LQANEGLEKVAAEDKSRVQALNLRLDEEIAARKVFNYILLLANVIVTFFYHIDEPFLLTERQIHTLKLYFLRCIN